MHTKLMVASLCGALLTAAPAAAQDMRIDNRVLSADETMWHVRAALNVAALSCRDADERDTTTAYNAMLSQEHEPLAHASAGVEAQYRARYGAAWQARDDGDMTRLYNYFAAPRAQGDFCAVAKAVLHDAVAVEPADFAAFAAQALPALERPFVTPVEIAPIEMASQPLGESGAEVMIATSAPIPFMPGR